MFNEQKQLGVALATAFLIALPAMMATQLVEYDEAIFLDVAHNIQQTGLPLRSIGQTGVFRFDHTPLYLYLLSLIPVPSAAGVLLARLATMAFGLGSIWLVFLIGKQIAGAPSGFAAALLLALNPFFALYSFFVRMEVPMVFWSLLGLLLIMTNEGNQRPRRLALAGLALAIAVLLKEVALLIVGYSVAYMLLIGNHNRRWPWREAILLGAPTVVALAGWAIWCWKLSPSAFTSTMSRWLNSTVTGQMLDPRGFISASQWAGQIALSLLGPGLTICLLAIVAWSVMGRRKPRFSQQVFLWGYLVLAISFSFVMRLKELRHIITTIPVAALLVGTTIDWHQIELNWRQGSWQRRVAYGLVFVLILCAASPLRIPPRFQGDLEAWIEPLYSWRVFQSDRYHNVLYLTGLYLREHTRPTEVIAIVHQATVVGYYADRHYEMLYTKPLQSILHLLAEVDHLVWDATVFLALDDEQIQLIEAYVAQHYAVEQTIQDGERQVTIYRRRAAGTQ